jgi:Protein of unknown function (DUF1592)/Protein of unknown function (DUF1588)/Protein of unknown function (DUF1595)/Protein of unknown function (DUF1587)/Protein of unknown function (DUF1585)
MRKTKDTFGYRELCASALLLVASGCTGVSSLATGGDGLASTGSVAGGATTPGGTTPTPGGTTAGAGGSSATGPVGTLNNVPAGPLDSGRLTLRRLNDREFDATMRDLLGTTQTLAANGFPGDSSDDGFDTVGSALSFSSVLFKQQFAAVGTLVGELMARPTSDALRTTVMVCAPTAANLATCLPQILTSFMPRAWRRPVTAAEVASAAAVGTAVLASAAGGTDAVTTAVSAALQYVLTSPNFLYHVELGSPAIVPSSAAVTPLSDYEVASRLSYFLWSTMPDAALTQAAAAGQLSNGSGVPAQVTRMIADPKFSGFTAGFTDQWLGVNNIASNVAPDPVAFPDVDATLIGSIGTETETFFANLITTKAPLAELLTADYTFANGRLAQFYGVKGVPATQATFTKLSLAGTPRLGGILTQETFLTTTSLPTRTSPVKRGANVLGQMVCTPPAPPPANIPALIVPAAGSGLTVRQALDQHASNPACSSCHNAMDPIGYTFENFDATGAYRTTDNGTAVDASGSLYGINGAPVNGAQGIAQAIAADPRFAQCIVKQAMTFAIGRTFDAIDGLGYIETVAQPLQKGGTWESALQAIATSQAFLTTRGGQ